jgi:hypothetical protein
MDRRDREKIRLAFFREHHRDRGFSSVAVRRAGSEGFCLYVGATRPLRLEQTYRGLPVRVEQTGTVVNAIQPLSEPG